MPQPFCQLEPDTENAKAFVKWVLNRDAESLDKFLRENQSFRDRIDTPWFAFDAPAIVAAKEHESVVKVLLKHGADINIRSSWWAGSFGVLDGVSKETASFLIKRGARFDIHSAAEQGEYELVSDFLENDPELVNARGGDGQTPLHTASTIEIVDLLLDRGAQTEIRCLDHSATAAQYAVSRPAICQHLIQRGAEPDVFMACALGDRELIELILKEEPDCLGSVVGKCPHTRTVDPRAHLHIYFWKLLGARTPLDVARTFNHRVLYEALFQRVDAVQQFVAACWDANAPIAKQLVLDHPDLVSKLDDDQAKLLGRAAWEGKKEAVQLMMELGFDPHLKGDEDSTPLDRAAFHGYRDVVDILLKDDPAPPLTEKNRFGGVPLSCCIYGATHSWKTDTDHAGTAIALIEAGAKIDPAWFPIENPEMNQLLLKRFKSQQEDG